MRNLHDVKGPILILNPKQEPPTYCTQNHVGGCLNNNQGLYYVPSSHAKRHRPMCKSHRQGTRVSLIAVFGEPPPPACHCFYPWIMCESEAVHYPQDFHLIHYYQYTSQLEKSTQISPPWICCLKTLSCTA